MKSNEALKIVDLHVEVAGKKVLKGVNFSVKAGEVHALFGPNGSGKTTLISAIMGFQGFNVTKGDILFDGKSILALTVDERAKLGLGLSFQRPPVVRGVSLKKLSQLCAKTDGARLEQYSRDLNMEEFLEREVNVGFSGGEIKRAELLQLLLQDPTFVFLDEPESGVDLENIVLLGNAINHLLGRKREPDSKKPLMKFHHSRKSGLIITHTGHILEYVEADVGCVLVDGKIICSGNPREILHTIRKCGYHECYRCFGDKKIEDLNSA